MIIMPDYGSFDDLCLKLPGFIAVLLVYGHRTPNIHN